MKIFISADMEGIAGITSREECDPDTRQYSVFQEQMTAEVASACEGAFEAGAREILVKDAHWSGRNIITGKLPRGVKTIRGWSGHPYGMMEGLDSSFNASILIGYHSAAGSLGNPLSHTLSSARIAQIKINSRRCSEFMLSSFTSMLENVPVVFLSGDENIAREALEFNKNIKTFETFRGFGMATESLHPQDSVQEIKTRVRNSLDRDLGKINPELPENFSIEVSYLKPQVSFKMAFYPGAKSIDDRTIQFESKNFFEVLRFLAFVI